MRVHPARLEVATMMLFMFAILATILYMLDYAGVISILPAFLR
jgi:hypothetical protein